MIYDDCIIKGPYNGEKGRKVVHIYFPDGRRKVTTLAKYLMEKQLNISLKENETVDHIDRNFNNDIISNFQILDKFTHASLDSKRVKDVIVTCVWCEKEFTIEGKKIKDRNRRKSGPFCSKYCAGKYSAELQNKRTKYADKKEVTREYYYLEKQRDVAELV